MRNQYKILAEKYNQVLEADQEPTLRVGPDGTKSWRLNGKFHRLDGPAIECTDGTKAWFINGKEYSENEFNKEIWDRNPTRRNILKRASGKAGIEMDI